MKDSNKPFYSSPKSDKIQFLQTIISNPCVRCGKDRIVVRTWEEKSKSGIVTYSITSCPDPNCQKIVSDGIRKEKARWNAQKTEARFREEARKKLLADKRAEKLAL